MLKTGLRAFFWGPFFGSITLFILFFFHEVITSVNHTPKYIISLFFQSLGGSIFAYPFALVVGGPTAFLGGIGYWVYLKNMTSKNPNAKRRSLIGAACGATSIILTSGLIAIFLQRGISPFWGTLFMFFAPASVSGWIVAALTDEHFYINIFPERK